MSDSERRPGGRPKTTANLPEEHPVAAWTSQEEPLRAEEREVLERMSDWVPALTLACLAASAVLVGVALIALLGGGVSTPVLAVSALMPGVLVAVGLLLPGFLRARHDLHEGTATHYQGPITLYRDYVEGSGPTLQLLIAEGRKLNTGPHEKKSLTGTSSPLDGTLVYAPHSKRILAIYDGSGGTLFDAAATRQKPAPPTST
jgi:hypothetical protein